MESTFQTTPEQRGAVVIASGAEFRSPDRFTVTIEGSAMSPTAENGDFALADPSKGLETGEGIFAFRNPWGTWVRRIQIMIDGSLLLCADNSDYDNEKTTRDQIEVIGRVTWIARKV